MTAQEDQHTQIILEAMAQDIKNLPKRGVLALLFLNGSDEAFEEYEELMREAGEL